MATRRRKSKGVTKEAEKEEDKVNTEGQTEIVSSSEQTVRAEEEAPTESTEKDRDEQDSQMDTVIEVKGSTSTVTVSWDEKNEEEEADAEKRANASDQMMDTEEQIISSAESQTDRVVVENESKPAVTVSCDEKNEEAESDDAKQETDGGEETVKETAVNGKRKADSAVETSPPKKTKLINDGFCLFVGNLNNSKTFEEVKDSLANYLMTQSLLVQDIRLDRSKKHAFVDLASQMDLTKALTLDGELMLDKPMKIAQAKVKSAEKVKAPLEDRKAAKDARCLFLKNVPYNATKNDILKIFHKAVAVRFPGGSEGPDKGIAFVEFKNKSIAKKICQKKRVVMIQDRVLIVDCVGETKVAKANDDNNTKAAAPPSNTLFVGNLSYNVKEKNLKDVFPKAVSIKMPENKGKSKGFAFVQFVTVEDAESALQSSQDKTISKRTISVEFCKIRAKPEKQHVRSKTLIVTRLAEKTTAETLKNAFEGALSARIAVDKETGASRRFGFVEFESEEESKAVKEAMEDCEIDGSKVAVAYANPPGQKGRPAGQGAARGGKGSRGGKGRGSGTPRDAVKVKNKA